MMRIVYTLCETLAVVECLTHVHDFHPQIPVACIFAAGPELARLTPKGFSVGDWRCVDVDDDASHEAPGSDNRALGTAR